MTWGPFGLKKVVVIGGDQTGDQIEDQIGSLGVGLNHPHQHIRQIDERGRLLLGGVVGRRQEKIGGPK